MTWKAFKIEEVLKILAFYQMFVKVSVIDLIQDVNSRERESREREFEHFLSANNNGGTGSSVFLTQLLD